MTVSDILRDAARLIRERGWCQESMGDPLGRLCAIGAIYKAIEARQLNPFDALARNLECRDAIYAALGLPPRQRIYHRLHRMEILGPCPIPEWNDHETQTAANVVAALEFAALHCEQQHAAPAREAVEA